MPVSLLTGKRNKSSSASPEGVALRGRRFVTASEPDSGESESYLNMGIVKQLTGERISLSPPIPADVSDQVAIRSVPGTFFRPR